MSRLEISSRLLPGHAEMRVLQKITTTGATANGSITNCSNPRLVPNRAMRDRCEYMSSPHMSQYKHAMQEVACRKCDNCRVSQSFIKSSRLTSEVMLTPPDQAFMVTLTKDDIELSKSMTTPRPPTKVSPEEREELLNKGVSHKEIMNLRRNGWKAHPTLDYGEVQQFMQNIYNHFRTRYNPDGSKITIRYSATQEYGELGGARRDGNPHYHIGIFGLTRSQLVEVVGPYAFIENNHERVALWKENPDSGCWFRSEPINKDLPMKFGNIKKVPRGTTHVIPFYNEAGELQKNTINYLCSYVAKKSTGVKRKMFAMEGREVEKNISSTGRGSRCELLPGQPEWHRGPLGAGIIPRAIAYVEQQIQIEQKIMKYEGQQLTILQALMLVNKYCGSYLNAESKPIPIGDWAKRKTKEYLRERITSATSEKDVYHAEQTLILENGMLQDKHAQRLKNDQPFAAERRKNQIISARKLVKSDFDYERKRSFRNAPKGARQTGARL